VTANGVVDVPVITVAAVTLGDVCAENVEVVVHDIPEIRGYWVSASCGTAGR